MTNRKLLSFYNPLEVTQPKIWPNYTLLMPVCAVGNIGQLACDLIISTLLERQECQLVGRIYSPSLMSVVGPNAFNSKGPATTSTEVYESKKHKLLIVQQRTSYYKHLKSVYIDELVEWIKQSKFDNVLVLSSSFSHCNPDTKPLESIGLGSSIQSMRTKLYEASDRWKALQIPEIPNRKSIRVVQDGLSFLPGSGMTKSLMKAFEKNFVAAAFLVNFCSEGVNIRDCYDVVNIVAQILLTDDSGKPEVDPHRQPVSWIEPYSWTCQ